MFGTIFSDLMVLFCILMVGFIIREIVKPLQKLFIPASVIGGLIALILGPQVLGILPLPESLSEMPGPMINLVLTAMILGTTITKAKIKNYATATNLVCMSYFAQLAVGVLVGLGLSAVWTKLPAHWGIMSVFSFFGGHGAATSAGGLFEEMGVDGNLDLGIILATLGLMLAILVGMVVVNFGVRKGWAVTIKSDNRAPSLFGGVIPKEKQNLIGHETVSGSGINSLALQFGLLMLSMWLGTQLFGLLARAIPATETIPSLLYGMVGAAIIWFFMGKTHLDKYLDKKSISTISGFALEICVTAAVATLNVSIVGQFFVPILIYTVVIISLMLFICFVVGKRWLKKDWFETMLIIFGQGLGSATTGVALGRCVDPDAKTGAFDSFGISSGLFAPVSSVLVALLPLLAMKNDFILVGIGVAVVIVNIVLGEFVFKRINVK